MRCQQGRLSRAIQAARLISLAVAEVNAYVQYKQWLFSYLFGYQSLCDQKLYGH